jgi:hypothetical protein
LVCGVEFNWPTARKPIRYEYTLLEYHRTNPPPELLYDVILSSCEAVQSIHANGIGHLDLCDRNIMVTKTGMFLPIPSWTVTRLLCDPLRMQNALKYRTGVIQLSQQRRFQYTQWAKNDEALSLIP